MAITPEQARQELARRELARRQEQQQPQQSQSTQQKNILPDLLKYAAATGAGVGAGIGVYKVGKAGLEVAAQTLRGILNLPKIVNVNKGSDFAKQVRTAYVQAHTEKVNKFGNQITELAKAQPNKVIDLSEFVKEITNDPDITSQTMSIFKKTPILGKILDNPATATQVQLKDAQTIINHLGTKIPANIRANNLDLIDAVNTVKAAQLDAFPEMANVRAEYKAFIEPYKNVKPYFKFNKILNAIVNKFGGPEGQVAVEDILPKKILKQTKGYRAAKNLSEIPQNTPFVGEWFKNIGGMLSFYPMISQAINVSQQMEEAKKKGMFTIDNSGNIVPLSKEDLMI